MGYGVDSIVYEWNLVCDDTWKLSTIQGSYMGGVFVGCMVWGWASDKFGRRLTMLVAAVIQVVSSILAAFSPNYIIFGFGLFSVGSSARSSEETSLSQADLSGGMCFIMYTSGAEEKLSCIQRTACEDPKTASEYATSAKMVYKVHKMVGLNFSPKYETVLNALEDAKSHALAGGDCSVYAW